jgi:hypothetical protein
VGAAATTRIPSAAAATRVPATASSLPAATATRVSTAATCLLSVVVPTAAAVRAAAGGATPVGEPPVHCRGWGHAKRTPAATATTAAATAIVRPWWQDGRSLYRDGVSSHYNGCNSSA